jgi:hypothetical protein
LVVKRIVTIIAAAALSAAAPGAAATFIGYAQFTRDTNTTVSYVEGPITTLTLGDTDVSFEIQALGPIGITDLVMSGSASTTEAETSVGPFLLRGGFAGTISFLDGPTNYLTVSFDNALLSGIDGGSAGSLIASTPQSAITVTSDVLDLAGYTLHSFSISMSGLTPPFGSGTGDYEGALAGTFSTAIPEPATWALMLAGFGLVGFAMRRQRLLAA